MKKWLRNICLPEVNFQEYWERFYKINQNISNKNNTNWALNQERSVPNTNHPLSERSLTVIESHILLLILLELSPSWPVKSPSARQHTTHTVLQLTQLGDTHAPIAPFVEFFCLFLSFFPPLYLYPYEYIYLYICLSLCYSLLSYLSIVSVFSICVSSWLPILLCFFFFVLHLQAIISYYCLSSFPRLSLCCFRVAYFSYLPNYLTSL